MTGPTDEHGLSFDDLSRETARFGVAEAQVRRDHVISHMLAAIARHLRDDVLFFGGTALSRTHLVDARLSEDIDLIAMGRRSDVARNLTEVLNDALLRTHGRIAWTPGFGDRDVEAAIATVDGITIRLQLLSETGYSPWPRERVAIEQRYADAPPAVLFVPTRSSFAGWKTATWHDRGAARDLFDLWALARADALTAEAAELFVEHGPIGAPPREWMFTRAPTERTWRAALDAQTTLHVSAAEALTVVRAAWSRALGELWD